MSAEHMADRIGPVMTEGITVVAADAGTTPDTRFPIWIAGIAIKTDGLGLDMIDMTITAMGGVYLPSSKIMAGDIMKIARGSAIRIAAEITTESMKAATGSGIPPATIHMELPRWGVMMTTMTEGPIRKIRWSCKQEMEPITPLSGFSDPKATGFTGRYNA